MNHYVLFTGENCQPCEVVKGMIRQTQLKQGLELEIVSAMHDPRTSEFGVRSVPTLVDVGTGNKINGVFEIVKEVTRE